MPGAFPGQFFIAVNDMHDAGPWMDGIEFDALRVTGAVAVFMMPQHHLQGFPGNVGKTLEHSESLDGMTLYPDDIVFSEIGFLFQ